MHPVTTINKPWASLFEDAEEPAGDSTVQSSRAAKVEAISEPTKTYTLQDLLAQIPESVPFDQAPFLSPIDIDAQWNKERNDLVSFYRRVAKRSKKQR